MRRAFIEPDPRTTLIILLLAFTACVVVSAGIFIALPHSYMKTWSIDVMGLLDTANRVHLGQAPYKDFHLLYGPLVAIIPAWGLDIGLKGGAIFGFNALAVSCLLLPAAAFVLAPRITLPSALLLFVFIWLMIVVPLGEGRPFDEITWGTYYNRHGWAALIVLLMFYVAPVSPRRRDVWIDAVVLAGLVLFEAYTKFNFGVVALGFVAANAVVSRYNRAVSLRSLGIIACSAAVLEALFRFHHAYWRNIAEYVAKSGGATFDYSRLLSMCIGNGPLILSCCGALLAVRLAGRRSALDVLFVIGAIAANALIRSAIGDDPTGRFVALFAVLLCLGELARRAENAGLAREPGKKVFSAHWASLACLLLALMAVVTEGGNRVLALENYGAKVTGLDRRPLPLDTLQGVPDTLAGFTVFRDAPPTLFDLTAGNTPDDDATLTKYRNTRAASESLTAEEYMRGVVEGINLLRSVDYRGHSVLIFEMVNPFTYALGMRPGSNGFPQFWLTGGAYSLNPQVLPSPEALFSDNDYVMVPRLPAAASQLINMTAIYGPYLSEHYASLKASPHWQLWSRKSTH